MQWLNRNITLGNLINLGTLLLMGAGFYFTTTITLKQHDMQIATITSEAKEFRERLLADLQRSRERDAMADLRIIERITAVEVEVRGLRADLQRLDGQKTRREN